MAANISSAPGAPWNLENLSTTSTGNSQLRGDASETFAFAYFWPDAVQPPVAAIADGVYNALVALRVCTPFSTEDVQVGNEQATARGEGGLPHLLDRGSTKHGRSKQEEAERRRALALKALDQRLHAASSNSKQQTPESQPAAQSEAAVLTVSTTEQTHADQA
ncbi:MAG: hypothetical protein LQ350_000692 [Teloschistes chrysophthalmus]|nr:MAG: hypothetical protein LQ350_000692 [Niorma chrysophthalma]